MKRISVILALTVMLATMSSCGRGRVQDVQKRLDEGEKVTVGIVIESLTNSYTYQMVAEVKAGLEAKGISVEHRTSEGDDALMALQISELVRQEADAIVCAPPRAEAVKEALLAAEKEDIPVIMMGRKPDYSGELSGGAYVNWEELGYELGKMASAWVDTRYPDASGGQIRAANIVSESQEAMVEQNTGLLRAISEDERIVIVYTQAEAGTADGGKAAAEAAIESDPGIKIFYCFQDGPALGVSSYITGLEPEEEGREIDITDYACFTAGIQAGSLTAISKSAQGGSILRGIMEYGTYSSGRSLSAAEGLLDTIYSILTGTASPDNAWAEDDRWARTSFGYEYLYDNPRNDFRAD